MNNICQGNHLLSALLYMHAEGLPRQAETVDVAAGATLHLAGRALSHVYFPLTSVISVQQLLENGCVAEILSVGNEGMAGMAACMGAADTLAAQLVVSAGGSACRIPTGAIRQLMCQGGPSLGMLLRYAQSELTQIGHISACGCHHGTVQRTCRWLLSMQERRPPGAIDITHDTLAGILGVRRESITEVLRRLRRMGVLSTRRGHLSILDRAALRSHACECSGLLHQELTQLLADLRRRAPAQPQAYRRIAAPPISHGNAGSLYGGRSTPVAIRLAGVKTAFRTGTDS